MSEPPLLTLAAVTQGDDRLLAAFALLVAVREGRTRQDSRYVDLELADATATVQAKIWDDDGGTQDAALALAATDARAVKVLFHAKSYQGRLQLEVHRIRAVADDEPDLDPVQLYGEGFELVSDLFCTTLVFDIETVPAVSRRDLPSTITESLAKTAQRMESDESKVMSLSPFFGKVVSLAIGDGDAPPDEQRVTVLVVPPAGTDVTDLPAWIRPMTEPELLRAWWCLAARAKTVVSYNGRGFDVPFLQTRSLVHGIPSRIDLLSKRYALRPHLDLYAVLTNGRALGPSNLDVVCWALGIDSPKGEMDGSMVAPAYEKGEIEKIAHYNAHDVRATTEVFRRVREHMLRYREDW